MVKQAKAKSTIGKTSKSTSTSSLASSSTSAKARSKEQRLRQQNLDWQKTWQSKLKRMPQTVFEYNRFGPLLFAFIVGVAGMYYAFSSFATPINTEGTSVQNTAVINLSIEPSASRVSRGQTLTLRVWADSQNQSVSVVNARLNFPPDLFEFVAADTNTSSFAQGSTDTVGSATGSVAFTRAAPHGLTGRQLVAAVTFRAKANVGSGAISFSKDSALLRASDRANILQHTSTGHYDISSEVVPSGR